MRPIPDPKEPGRLESEIREFWARRQLPESDGVVPAPPGGVSVTFLSAPLPTVAAESAETLHRLLLLDVAARYVRLSGRGVRPELLGPAPSEEGAGALDAGLDRYGCWIGRNGRRSRRSPPDSAGVQRALDRLAEAEVLCSGTVVQRFCPTCAEVRTPQRVRYREGFGRTYLIRVPLAEPAPAASLIVWTEAVWKLLATTAILVSPDQPYVRARFHRRGFEEQIVIAKAALPRLEEWMPGGTIEILEERPGSAWAGTAYRSPLADSVPALRELPAPAGTVQATPEVSDAGTGIVTMTPAHGPADAQLGRTLHWPGPDVLRADGMIGGEPRHKYTGLPLDTAEACVLRELLDDGFVFAELRVHRGVPHCLVCSQPTVWRPGTAWSLDLGRLPQGVAELYARLLPEEPLPAPSELLAWPVSDGIPSSNPKDPALRLCPACGRLSPSGSTGSCKCGQAAPAPVRQGLRSPFAEPLSTWLRLRAANVAGPTWLFLPARRRAPALLHELLAAWATGPLPGRELRLQSVDPLPGEPTELDIPAALPAEAARITLLKLVRGRSSRRSFQDSVTEEARWLARLGTLLVELHEEIARDGVSLPAPSAPLRLGELLPEDLALLARFERLRARAISAYDRGEWEAGFSQLVSFIDRELRDGYLRLTRPRRTATHPSASRLAVARVIALLLSRLSELLAPVLPFTSEAVHRDTPEEDRSLFERRITPVQESLLDADAERSLPVWEGLVASLDRARDGWGVSRSEPLPQLVLVAVRDEDSARLLPQLPVLARLAGAVKVEVFGPSRPWTQRRVSIRFDKEAIRQAYPVYHRRILSMLETLDPKRVREAVKSQTLAVAIEGQPAVRIAPSMVEVVETLPERFVSFTWPGGEAYAELPAGAAEVRAPRGGHLPAEVDRIAIHLKWRLRARAGAESPAKAFICAPEPIAAEVQRNAATLAERSGLAQVLRVDSPRLFLPAETSSGRSRRGHEWQVWVPGLRTPTRAAKHRSPKKEDPLRIAVPTTLPAGVTDMLAEPVRERATGIQELLAALDARCNLAALGSTKLGYAWDAGFHTVEAIASAEPAEIARLPGFGPAVAWTLIQRLAPDRELPPLPSPENGHAPPSPPSIPELVPPVSASPTPRELVPPSAPPAPAVVAPPMAALPAIAAPPVQLPPVVPAAPAAPPPLTPLPAPRVSSAGSFASPPKPPEMLGGVELDSSASLDRSWDQFLARTRDGASGLWVGRVFPPALRAASGSADIRFLWLSAANRPNSVRPTDLEALEGELLAATEQHRVSAVILQELEYLVTVNGVEPVARWLRRLQSHSRRLGVTVWMPVNPELLPGGDLEPLEQALASPG